MFKKICTLMVMLVILIITPVSKVRAAEANNVKDFMNLLNANEAQEIQTMIEGVAKDLNLDVVVVITKDTEGKTSRDFADDYYDYNGYGVGSDHSGILLLINMGKRETWITTTGRAIDIFTDGRIDDITKNVTKELSKERYFEGCKNFLKAVRNYGELGVPKGQHRVTEDTTVKKSYLQRVLYMMRFFPVYLGALAVAIVSTVIASLSRKGKVTINNRTYEDGTFKLLQTRDDYIREDITRTKIQTSSNDENTSSTHTSSSGETHGGGGGSF